MFLFLITIAVLACLALIAIVGSPEINELKTLLVTANDGVTETLAEQKSQGQEITRLRQNVDELRRLNLRRNGAGGARPRGGISDDAAANLGAAFVLHAARSGKLDALASSAHYRDGLLSEARRLLGVEQRAALTTSEIPLPTEYSGELMELIAEFGMARQNLTIYPMGGGTNKPPRVGTRPAFQSVVMSAAFPQLSPTITFASLESHKVGGLVIVPREIDEQSIVAFGNYLARYGAVEFARAEDTWAFLADGSATYESVVGICKTAVDNGKHVTLGATKTAPSDAVLDDFRALRRKVNTAVLGRGGAYYLNRTWEARLRAFNNAANDPFVFAYRPDGISTLDGFPIVWTEVLAAYDTAAAPSAYVAVFGALKFWWFGVRGMPRMDFSEHVYFVNDQLATRFIEEIDFDYNAIDSAAVLRTAAA